MELKELEIEETEMKDTDFEESDFEEPEFEEAEVEEIQLSEVEISRLVDRLRSQQNFVGAIAAGGIAAVVAAAIWAFLTVETGHQIGFMAIGVGFVVGLAVGRVGKGIDRSFGFIGAAWALLGCGLGNLLAVCGFISQQEGMPVLEVITRLDVTIAKGLMVATFEPMDIVFYGIAVWAGYRYSFRQLTDSDFEQEVVSP